MTNRERVIACATCKELDRSPFSFCFGPWGETISKWAEEGISNPNVWFDNFNFDKQVQTTTTYVNQLYCPGFVPEILEQNGNVIIQRDWLGQTIEIIKNKEGIPRIIKSPVETIEDWEKIREERLNPDSSERFLANWMEIAKKLNDTDAPVQVGAWPCGLYGTLRDLLGVENSLYAFYDDPPLVHRIMDDLTDFWIQIYEKICKDVRVDILHIWEDMSGRQGSLISPKLIREFMLPNYKKLKSFADDHNIPIIQVDTDGNCEELIPLFAEGGVNMMLPFEVQAGCNIVELRKKYPYMSMMGGIDKLEIAKGKEAIDKELERIRPLINQTGYFPALDHMIHPEISFSDYTYFVTKLEEMIKVKADNTFA